MEQKLDQGELREALYMISRVQEATVQQERLVTTGKFKDVQRNNINMGLQMMERNYKLADQIVVASNYIEPRDQVLQATNLGNQAIDILQTAREYFGKELQVTSLSNEQRKFLVDAMQTTRLRLEEYLKFMPSEDLEAARRRVEDENAANLREYKGEDGAGILNPVTLPWKKS